MTSININIIILAVILLSITNVEAFLSSNRVQRTFSSSTSSLRMAGGRVPLVPYYPNKATGSKDYQWMDIYNALGRERYTLSFLLASNCIERDIKS